MQATRFEYRFRFALHALIFTLAYTTPWRNALPLDRFHSLWELAATKLAESGLLAFQASFVAVLVVSLALLAVAAVFRVWGSAYLGSSVVLSGEMHSQALLADGPFRHTRNPLYLGTLVHTLGVSLLMPPSGALLAITLIWVLQFRLALAEEPFLAARFGAPYLAYKARVPRFVPSPAPLVPAAGQRPRWLQALLGEFYFVAVPVVLGIFGWQFNRTPLLRGILISLGISIILYAFLPRAEATEPAMSASS